MSNFTTTFKGELIGKNLWKVFEPFEYHVGSYPSNEVITVPVGYITDFASVPRVFWPLISPIDNHAKAGALHDFLYTEGKHTRKECDKIFKEALIVLETKPWKVWCMYKFCRWFGWWKWYKERQLEKEEQQ